MTTLPPPPPPPILYAESLCCTSDAAWSRAPFSHALGGLALGVASERAWTWALVAPLLELALALAHGAASHAGARIALGLFYVPAAAAGWLLRRAIVAAATEAACLAPTTTTATATTAATTSSAAWFRTVRRTLCLGVLWALAAWRVDDVLCVARTPVGLVRSLMLWLGAVLLDAYVWRPASGDTGPWTSTGTGAAPYLLAAHLGGGAWLYAHALVEYAPAWQRALVATLVLLAAAAVARLMSVPLATSVQKAIKYTE